jgi:hypothetical protein
MKIEIRVTGVSPSRSRRCVVCRQLARGRHFLDQRDETVRRGDDERVIARRHPFRIPEKGENTDRQCGKRPGYEAPAEKTDGKSRNAGNQRELAAFGMDRGQLQPAVPRPLLSRMSPGMAGLLALSTKVETGFREFIGGHGFPAHHREPARPHFFA